MVSLTSTEFADKVNENMYAISRVFMKQHGREFYKEKLTLPQLGILDLLHRSSGLNMSDLARSMNVTTAAMTGLVDRLVRDHYVLRDVIPNDRRVIKIKLTSKGEQIIKKVIEHRRELIVKIFGTLSQSEREEYLRILTRIREGLQA